MNNGGELKTLPDVYGDTQRKNKITQSRKKS